MLFISTISIRCAFPARGSLCLCLVRVPCRRASPWPPLHVAQVIAHRQHCRHCYRHRQRQCHRERHRLSTSIATTIATAIAIHCHRQGQRLPNAASDLAGSARRSIAAAARAARRASPAPTAPSRLSRAGRHLWRRRCFRWRWAAAQQRTRSSMYRRCVALARA